MAEMDSDINPFEELKVPSDDFLKSKNDSTKSNYFIKLTCLDSSSLKTSKNDQDKSLSG